MIQMKTIAAGLLGISLIAGAATAFAPSDDHKKEKEHKEEHKDDHKKDGKKKGH